MGLIIGIPFVVVTLSLLWIFRSERRRREAGLGSGVRWMPIYRGIAVVLVLFVAVEVAGIVLAAVFGPPRR